MSEDFRERHVQTLTRTSEHDIDLRVVKYDEWSPNGTEEFHVIINANRSPFAFLGYWYAMFKAHSERVLTREINTEKP